MSGASARSIRIFSPEVSTDSVIHESPLGPQMQPPREKGEEVNPTPPPSGLTPRRFLCNHMRRALLLAGLGCIWLA